MGVKLKKILRKVFPWKTLPELNTSPPPKDREFLGLVDHEKPYWDFFWWATKEDGASKACYVDRSFYAMPSIKGWVEMPRGDVGIGKTSNNEVVEGEDGGGK